MLADKVKAGLGKVASVCLPLAAQRPSLSPRLLSLATLAERWISVGVRHVPIGRAVPASARRSVVALIRTQADTVVAGDTDDMHDAAAWELDAQPLDQTERAQLMQHVLHRIRRELRRPDLQAQDRTDRMRCPIGAGFLPRRVQR